ncbi:MAG: VWA domain-containing protein [Acidobacteria bacterium]|nr:MAG: VWA domain-containing protein [Acidobacteriota bacterium]
MIKGAGLSNWARGFSGALLAVAFLGLLVVPPSITRCQQASSDTAGIVPSTSPSGPARVSESDTNPNGNNRSIKVKVEVVNVPVTVLDKRGNPVIDLTQNDFKIFEDGKAQSISYFSSESMPPLRIGLLVDTSNSARFELKFEEDAASEFAYTMLRGLNSKNQVFLETFDAGSSVIQDFTNNPDDINEKLRKLKAGGGKAVYDAIYEACKHVITKAGPREQTRRVLILISDGIDVGSKHSLEEAVSMAHRAETAIYSIGNTPNGFANPGEKYLEQVAQDTGGMAFFPERKTPGTDYLTGYLSHGQFDTLEQNKGLDAETGIYTAEKMIALADSLEAIRRQLTNQYLIGYKPGDDTLDGTYRKIHVVALRKGVTVRYKPGYFATSD